MLKYAVTALLFVPFFFASCSKDSSNNGAPPNEFIINGIADVTMSPVGGNILPIAIHQTSGTQEQVTISVTGLPAGISASLNPASGTPDFGSFVTFNWINPAVGTFPIKITGTSPSYTKSYNLNLIVPGNGFEITGIRDVNMGTTGRHTLPLNVVHTTGTKEPVTLSVTGLPAGITVNALPSAGTPNFASNLEFAGDAAPGTYPIKIVGTAASFSKSYDVNLIVPAFNGYKFRSLTFQTKTLTLGASGGYFVFDIEPVEKPNSNNNLTGRVINAWPTADGTYTYQTVSGPPTAANTMQVILTDGFVFNSDPGSTVTVKITGGKFSVSMQGIPMRYPAIGASPLTVDARQ